MLEFFHDFAFGLDHLDKALTETWYLWQDSRYTRQVAEFISKPLYHYFWLIPLTLWQFRERNRRAILWFILWTTVSLVLLNIAVDVLKDFFNRPRPLDWLGNQPDMSTDSRPSGHAANAFALLTLVQYAYRSRPWATLAGLLLFLVAVSRFFALKHYWSDIVFGAFLGWIFVELTRRALNKWSHLPRSLPAATDHTGGKING